MKNCGFVLPDLIKGRLIKRYKRFLADVELETGEKVTAHCPNSGSMKGCAIPGSPVWLSESDNPKRKYKFTWELIKVSGTMIGINTQVPNKLVKNAIEHNLVKELEGYENVKAEVYTSSHTRLDLLLEKEGRQNCYVEIKNCTLVENGEAMFPDAVTTRGQKHLDELEFLVFIGHRGVIFFLVQRMDAEIFKPAEKIDKVYARKLKKVVKSGVELIVRDVQINTETIMIGSPIPVEL